jgi:hypothetical protein
MPILAILYSTPVFTSIELRKDSKPIVYYYYSNAIYIYKGIIYY